VSHLLQACQLPQQQVALKLEAPWGLHLVPGLLDLTLQHLLLMGRLSPGGLLQTLPPAAVVDLAAAAVPALQTPCHLLLLQQRPAFVQLSLLLP
jgi:hypothetical protein